MATRGRLYTTHDEELERALGAAVDEGLTPAEAAPAKKLRALVLYAASQIVEKKERADTLVAYEELASDDERLETLRAWNIAAAEDGLL